MAKSEANPGVEHQVGVIVGTIEGLKTSVDSLSKRFDEHLAEHRQTWFWIVPTVISTVTLAVLVVSMLRG